MKKIATIITVLIAGLVTSCAAQTVSTTDDTTYHRTECSIPMTFSFRPVEVGTPVKYSDLRGLWVGEVRFPGDSANMCIAVAIEKVKANGETESVFVWNLGTGPASTNKVSSGSANWWAQTVVLFPGKGEQIVFAADRPHIDNRWYRYVLDFPTSDRPDKIIGYLEATLDGSATDPSRKAWSRPVEAFYTELTRVK